MQITRIILGIDGGGTKTRCLVADLNGGVLGEGIAGPSNYLVVGRDGAVSNVMTAIQQALDRAGRSIADVAAICAGLAGVGRPEDQSLMASAFAFPESSRLLLVPDARVALAGALNGRPGVILIAGTGSIAFGLDTERRLHRAGGWGWVLGDEGSGFDIGRRAIAAGLGALDGTGPATVLGERICQAWGLARLDQITARVYGDLTTSRTEIAALVPLVQQAAAEGDAVALGLLTRAGQDLAGLAAAVLGRINLPEPLVATTGGVLEGVEPVRTALAARLAELVPEARLVQGAGSPAEGALLLARELVAER